MRRFLALLLAAAAAGSFGSSAAAAQGGWAIASFDALPELSSGDTAVVSFRVLQHGVHPIDAAQVAGTDLHVDVTGAGATTSFPAVPDGTPGRFVATVDVPELSTVALSVVWDGGLVLQPNSVDVPVATPATPPTTGPSGLPIVLAAAGIGSAGLVALHMTRTRRRSRAATAIAA